MPRSTPPRRGPSRPARPRGIALLLVLLVMSIAIVVVAELAYQSELELLAASNVSDLGAIEYAIDGQFEVVLATLRYDKRQNEVDSEYDLWNGREIRSRRDGEVALETRVYDEGGKFNLIRLITGSDAQKQRARECLVRLIDVFREDVSEDKLKGGDVDVSDATEVVDRIVRHLTREGATGQVPKPKTQPTGVPLLLDELLFVDTKDNRLMATLLRDMQVGEDVAPGLHRFLTCYGPTKINLNTAPLPVLKCLFPNAQDREYAQGLIDRRRGSAQESGSGSGSGSSSGSGTGTTDSSSGNPFTDVNQVADGSVPGLTNDVLQRNGIDPAAEFDVKSDYFGVRIRGETERTQREELYVVERVKTEGFRFLLHQERTDPLVDTAYDEPPG